jgi:predicted TIM-barrel fold metal-dependent hydrolase
LTDGLGLVDCHLHLVYPQSARTSWMRGDPTYEGREFTWDVFDAQPGRKHIAACIFMEVDVDAGQYEAEARGIAELIADSAVPVIGQVAGCRPEEKGLEAWLEHCDELGIVGYRRILHAGVPDDLSRSVTFRENIRHIGRAGRTFDICMRADQLPLAAELAAACGDTQFVLDHCGNPDVASCETQIWRSNMREVAQRPNVAVKLSGILANCAAGHADEHSVRPYLDETISMFGTDRLVWGSDWPVLTARSDLGAWTRISRNLLDTLSTEDRARISWRNACRIYGLDPASVPGLGAARTP